MERINVTIPTDDKDWLDDQPHLTASGLLQKAIQEQRNTESENIERKKAIAAAQADMTPGFIIQTCDDCGYPGAKYWAWEENQKYPQVGIVLCEDHANEYLGESFEELGFEEKKQVIKDAKVEMVELTELEQEIEFGDHCHDHRPLIGIGIPATTSKNN